MLVCREKLWKNQRLHWTREATINLQGQDREAVISTQLSILWGRTTPTRSRIRSPITLKTLSIDSQFWIKRASKIKLPRFTRSFGIWSPNTGTTWSKNWRRRRKKTRNGRSLSRKGNLGKTLAPSTSRKKTLSSLTCSTHFPKKEISTLIIKVAMRFLSLCLALKKSKMRSWSKSSSDQPKALSGIFTNS